MQFYRHNHTMRPRIHSWPSVSVLENLSEPRVRNMYEIMYEYIIMNTFIYTHINEYEREIRVQQGDKKALFKFITAHIGDLDTNKL